MKLELPPSIDSAPSGTVTLRLLEIFSQVAQHKTMSAAATQLGLSQGAVSQSINALEQTLGIMLLDRSVRPPAVTLLGQRILDYANEIVEKVHELEATARYGNQRKLPRLHLGLQNSFTSAAGAHFLDQLRDLAEEWSVKSGYKSIRLQALVERESDVIITSDESDVPAEVLAMPLYSEPFFVVVPASYKGPTRDLAQISEHLDFIHYGQDSHMRPLLSSYFHEIGINPLRRYHFDTPDAALHVAAAGFGWVIVTPLIYLRSLADAKLIRLVLLHSPPRRKLVVAMRLSEGNEIAGRVHSAACTSLTSVVLPQIKRLSPKLARDVWVSKK